MKALPAVDVYFDPQFMNAAMADDIKSLIRRHAPRVLSSKAFPLEPDMFSFKFHQPSEYDDLSCVIIVRVHLRHKPDVVGADNKVVTMGEAVEYLAVRLCRLLSIADWPLGVEAILNDDSFWASCTWGTSNP